MHADIALPTGDQNIDDDDLVYVVLAEQGWFRVQDAVAARNVWRVRNV